MHNIDLETRQGQDEATRILFRGSDTAQILSVAADVTRAGRALVGSNRIALLLIALALNDDRKLALTTANLFDEPEADELLLAAWSENLELRQAAFALALRRGWQLKGALRDILLGELDVLDAADSAHVTDIQAALALLARVAPEETFNAAGVCSEVTAHALEHSTPHVRDALLAAYARNVGSALTRRNSLPEPRETHALMVLDLLAHPDSGAQFIELVSGELNLPHGAAAAQLARFSAHAGIEAAVAETGHSALDGDEAIEPLDAAILRGLLDAHQLAYEDINGDSWSAKLAHKDEFGQKVNSPLWIGLSGSKVTFRIVEPMPTPNDPDWWADLLARNHTSGLARYTLDMQGHLCLIAIASREGFTSSVFDQMLNDIRTSLEQLIVVTPDA